MGISRRGFLKSLGALAVASSIPAAGLVERWLSDGRIIDRHFVLNKPLDLRLPDGFLVDHCTFIAAPDFNKSQYLVNLLGGSSGVFSNNSLEGGGLSVACNRSFIIGNVVNNSRNVAFSFEVFNDDDFVPPSNAVIRMARNGH